MAGQARFRFYGRLVKLLTSTSGEAVFTYRFCGEPAVKDAIEALGLPHTEVDLILVAGHAVGFDYRLQADDRVEVFPFDAATERLAGMHLSPPLPEQPVFILDVHLGKLARRLRMLGFDSRYRNNFSAAEILNLARAEEAIILTRDRGLLKRAWVRQGYLVGSEQIDAQIIEVLERYRLHDKICPFSRCPACNGLLLAVAKAEIRQQLLPLTALYYETFQRCCGCRQLYWQGSHHAKIESWIKQLVADTPPG